MTITEITNQLNESIAELFKCEVSDLTESTGPGDIAGWDSLGHVMLLEAITAKFEREIPIEQAITAESIHDLASIIHQQAG